MATTYDDKKIIYTMDRVSRTYGTKTVLKDISISYYYGAKIGVIGENGSGKSSLMKIFAGKDTEFTGETSIAPGYTIGYLEQEPQLEAGKTVMEIVKEGAAETVALLEEFDKVNEAFGDPDADFEIVERTAPSLIEKVLEHGLPNQVSLNVNYPVTTPDQFKGFKVCTQTKSYWYEDFEETVDKYGNQAYYQRGHLVNIEPDNKDCDESAIAGNYASIVPVKVDFTDYKMIDKLKKWNL